MAGPRRSRSRSRSASRRATPRRTTPKRTVKGRRATDVDSDEDVVKVVVSTSPKSSRRSTPTVTARAPSSDRSRTSLRSVKRGGRRRAAPKKKISVEVSGSSKRSRSRSRSRRSKRADSSSKECACKRFNKRDLDNENIFINRKGQRVFQDEEDRLHLID